MKKLVLVVLFLAGGAYFGSKFYLHHRVGTGIDNMLLMAAPFADIEYEGVSSTFTGELSIDGITVRMHEYREPVTIRRLTMMTPGYFFLMNLADVARPGPDFAIPESFGFAAEGVSLATSSAYVRQIYELGRQAVSADDVDSVAAVCTGKYGFSPQTLEALGYRDLDVSVTMAYRQDDRHLFFDASADIVDMYRIDMTMELADRLTPEGLMSGLYRPRLASGRLEYLDQSLRKRTGDLCAARGLSEEEIHAAQMDSFAAAGIENGLEFDEYVLDPYKEFLGGKSTFVLTAQPHEPVGFSQLGLYNPADVPALLNLEGEVF